MVQELEENYALRLKRAQEHLQLALEYSSHRAKRNPIDSGQIKESIEIINVPAANLTTDQQALLWKYLDKFSVAISPATMMGLHFYDSIARNQSKTWSNWTISVVVFLVFITLTLQGYTLWGTQLLSELEQSKKELLATYDLMNQMKQADPLLKMIDSCENKTPDDKTTAAQTAFDQLQYKASALNEDRRQQFANLYRWNSVWSAPANIIVLLLPDKDLSEFWGIQSSHDEKTQNECKNVENSQKTSQTSHGNESMAPRENTQISYGNESMAFAFLKFLKALLLPALFSLLGAIVWILRETQRRRLEQSGPPPTWSQRIALALVLGCVTGVFTTPGDAQQLALVQNVPLIALTFFVGYNVEFFFTLLDRLISGATTTLAPTPPNPQESADRTQPTSGKQAGDGAPPNAGTSG